MRLYVCAFSVGYKIPTSSINVSIFWSCLFLNLTVSKPMLLSFSFKCYLKTALFCRKYRYLGLCSKDDFKQLCLRPVLQTPHIPIDGQITSKNSIFCYLKRSKVKPHVRSLLTGYRTKSGSIAVSILWPSIFQKTRYGTSCAFFLFF